jgi:hypothetical protein
MERDKDTPPPSGLGQMYVNLLNRSHELRESRDHWRAAALVGWGTAIVFTIAAVVGWFG